MGTEFTAILQPLSKHWVRPEGKPATVDAMAEPLGVLVLEYRGSGSAWAIKIKVGFSFLWHQTLSPSINPLVHL